KVNIIGFHGVTLLHNPKKKISFQLGVPELLAQNFNTDVIFNFRDNDILHGGEGAPLATVFHEYILKNLKKENDSVIINIGGIANGSYILNNILYSNDIGPGNCLLDEWI
ncbi:MAG: anhydro-N-acetylmuramic acid kinase, partial [Candidatus Fonsibacter sp.]